MSLRTLSPLKIWSHQTHLKRPIPYRNLSLLIPRPAVPHGRLAAHQRQLLLLQLNPPMATAVRQHLAMAARMEITAPTLAATAEMMADLSNQPTPTAETAEETRKETLVRILLTIS